MERCPRILRGLKVKRRSLSKVAVTSTKPKKSPTLIAKTPTGKLFTPDLVDKIVPAETVRVGDAGMAGAVDADEARAGEEIGGLAEEAGEIAETASLSNWLI